MSSQQNGTLREELERLDRRVEQLVLRCRQLQEENRILREAQHNLTAERAGLLEKNELARSRIEAMISRLKSMEQH